MDRRSFLTTSIAAGIAPRLRAQDLPAGILQPGMPGYEKARQPFNTCVALRPAFIAPCRTEAEVTQAINFARDQKLAVSIKSGGHSFTGFSLQNWEQAYYGSAYERLQEIKRRHDPENLIRHPQSVQL